MDNELDQVKIAIDPPSSSSSDGDDANPHISRRESIRLFRQQADDLENESKAFLTTDLDKAHAGEAPFNLREYFKNSYITAASHGGKPKRMGVTVKDLTVVGKAPEDSVIANNLTPIFAFFNLFNPNFWFVIQLWLG